MANIRDILNTFLKKRGLDDVIVKLDREGVDGEVLKLMSVDDWKEYLPRHGDRITTVNFVKNLQVGKKKMSAKETLLQKLRMKIQNDKGGVQAVSSESESDSGGVKKARKRQKQEKLKGNANARKSKRRLDLGWIINNDNVESTARQVKQRKGGGTRKLIVDRNYTKEDIIREGKKIFFPSGKNQSGKVEDFDFDVWDFAQDGMDNYTTIEDIYEKSKVKILRLYLVSSLKLHNKSSTTFKQSSDKDSCDDELPDPHIEPQKEESDILSKAVMISGIPVVVSSNDEEQHDIEIVQDESQDQEVFFTRDNLPGFLLDNEFPLNSHMVGSQDITLPLNESLQNSLFPFNTETQSTSSALSAASQSTSSALSAASQSVSSPLSVVSQSVSSPLSVVSQSLPSPLSVVSQSVSSPLSIVSQSLPSPLSVVSQSCSSTLSSASQSLSSALNVVSWSSSSTLSAASRALSSSVNARLNDLTGSRSNLFIGDSFGGGEAMDSHVMESDNMNTCSRILNIHSGNILQEMIAYFKDPSIVKEKLTIKRYTNSSKPEKGEGSGLLRDVYTEFWAEFYLNCTIGCNYKVPELRHDYQEEEWRAVGRILMKGYCILSYRYITYYYRRMLIFKMPFKSTGMLFPIHSTIRGNLHQTGV